MSGPNLALECAPRDPDPVFLEQLTSLATMSHPAAPGSWWRKAVTKSGIAAMAGVLAVSGTAYAERSSIEPVVRSVIGMSEQPAHSVATSPSATPAPPVTAVPSPQPDTRVAPPGQSHAADPTPPNPHGKAVRAHGNQPKQGRGLGWAR